ncbi:MAG TPA: glutathione S-transferase family protein [Alphaproteobacteria bacterium]
MAKAKKAARKAKKVAKRPRKTLAATARIKAAAKKSAARAAKGAPIRKSAAAKSAAKKKGADKYVLHGFFGSLPSCKIGLMLSMCGVRWDYRHTDLPSGQQRSPEFQGMNRFGQVPVLKHGDRTLCQSNTILWYLAQQTGRFGGRSDDEKLRILEWLNWDLADMAVGVGISRFIARMAPNTGQEMRDFIRQRGERALTTLDRHLGTSKFLVGSQPTIADVAIFPWVATAEEGGYNVANYPNVQAWAERMLTFPGVRHPYSLMPKEDRVAA